MIVIGVDGGATRTRVAIWRDGDLLGSETGSGSAIRPDRVLQSAALIAGPVRAALAKQRLQSGDHLVVGAAGAGRPSDADALRVALRGEHLADHIVVTTDVELALAAAPDADAVLLAGTGSVALARMGGERLQQGGHGWQMGDGGSAYWIGREALLAVARAADGRAEPTALTTGLVTASGVSNFRDLVGWAAVAAPREVAGLAAVVGQAANAGDSVAGTILDQAALELAALIDGLARQATEPVRRIALGGGLCGAGSPIRARLVTALSKAGRDVANDPIDPVAGALALATGGDEKPKASSRTEP